MNEENVKVVRNSARSVTWTHAPAEIVDGIFVTGEIPRRNNFEDTGGRFFLDEACRQPDPLPDDQALFFDTHKGLVVVLGCGHAGVINTLEHIRTITNNRAVRAVIGGLHLLNASPERINKTLEALRQWDISQIIPGHCTGLAAVARLWTVFPGRCSLCTTGLRLYFK